MKKIVALLITIPILFGAMAFAAAEGETNAVLNEAEDWAQVYSGIVGEGQVMQMEPLNPSDGINSRFIFVSDEWTGVELKVMARISETEVVCWRLPLNIDNVPLALGSLYNHVPMCYVESGKDGEEPKTAIYIKDSDSTLSFPEFINEAKRILRSACYGKIAAEEPSADPVLSLFPNLRWGMTEEEVIKEYGQEVFDKAAKTSPQTILGKEVNVCFVYEDRGLVCIGLLGQESIASIKDQLIETYNTLYGEPKRMNYIKALSGYYQENFAEDCNCWFFKTTVILVPDEINQITYRKIY